MVYYEHAHHQHHYDEHGAGADDGWGNGGYWRRSLEVNPQGDPTKH